MTDDRNATPGAAAPPPQAPPPIPAQPPYAPASPIPAPAYAQRTPWGWIVAAVLASVLITLVCLYFFTDLLSRAPRDSWDDSDSSLSQSGAGSQGSLGSASSAPRPYQPAPAPSTGTGSGYAPTVSWLQGTWGPSCPGSRAQVVTFYDGGRFTADGGDGTWTLDGENVTLVVGARTMLTRWEYLGPDMARVTQVEGGRSRTVQRCP